MSNQVQCPNCGGYKTETSKVEHILTREPVSSDERKKKIVGWLKGLLISIVIIAAIVYVDMTGIDGGLDSNSFLVQILGVSLCVVVIAPLAILYFWFQKTKTIPIENIYYYYCFLCGYKWSWETGTSLPKVNIRPDLIEQGNQRLEEERRKQQEDAAALYYLTHKK